MSLRDRDAGGCAGCPRTPRKQKAVPPARGRLPDAIRQAYSVVVTVNEGNAVHAFRLAPEAGPLFAGIKSDDRARIKETAVDAAALLPDGPYDLWREGDEARFVKDLAGAFARWPRLPKVLNPKILLDTVLQGVERGLLVARLARPDGSVRTWWREPVDPESHGDPLIEVVLPERAELDELPEDLLAPGSLPELWGEAGAAFPVGEPRLRIEEPRGSERPERPGAPFVPETGAHEGEPEAQRAPVLTLGGLTDYFRGGHVAHVPREGYDDTFVVPRCPPDALRRAIRRGVGRGAAPGSPRHGGRPAS